MVRFTKHCTQSRRTAPSHPDLGSSRSEALGLCRESPKASAAAVGVADAGSRARATRATGAAGESAATAPTPEASVENNIYSNVSIYCTIPVHIVCQHHGITWLVCVPIPWYHMVSLCANTMVFVITFLFEGCVSPVGEAQEKLGADVVRRRTG